MSTSTIESTILKFIKFYRKVISKDIEKLIECLLVFYDLKPSVLFSLPISKEKYIKEFSSICKENSIKLIYKKIKIHDESLLNIVLTKLDLKYVIEVMNSHDTKKIGEILGYINPGKLSERSHFICINIYLFDTRKKNTHIFETYGQKITDITEGIKQLSIIKDKIFDFELPKGYKIIKTTIAVDRKEI